MPRGGAALRGGAAAEASDSYYQPDPNDRWTERATDAVLMVDPNALPAFTQQVRDRIWPKLEAVLRGRGRYDVFELIVEATVPPLPDISVDWRARAATVPAEPPTNQGRRERAGGGYPERESLVMGSRAEAIVYDVLVKLQRARPPRQTFAIAPVPGAKLRDSVPLTPDFLVLGNGRAVVIEVDDRSHYGTTRKADDAQRDRHWERCGVPTIRLPAEYADDRTSLESYLSEYLDRRLWT